VRVGKALALTLALSLLPTPGGTHDAGETQRLPVVGLAPDFDLTSQDNQPVSLADYRGRVVAVTFIYTSCTDACPVLTALMVRVQHDLGDAFGSKIAFVSITVDPQRDSPQVLKQYAEDFGADLAGWAFLTGNAAAVAEVGRKYGIFAQRTEAGDVDHTFLTSLVDRHGKIRVQYSGVRFDSEEFRSDLLNLAGEAG